MGSDCSDDDAGALSHGEGRKLGREKISTGVCSPVKLIVSQV